MLDHNTDQTLAVGEPAESLEPDKTSKHEEPPSATDTCQGCERYQQFFKEILQALEADATLYRTMTQQFEDRRSYGPWFRGLQAVLHHRKCVLELAEKKGIAV